MAHASKIAASPDEDLAEVRRIVIAGLRGLGAHVFLFGSRARRSARPQSDIDVAILPAAPLPPGTLSAIREALDESRVPFAVDLVDLSRCAGSFCERVLAEGVPWSA